MSEEKKPSPQSVDLAGLAAALLPVLKRWPFGSAFVAGLAVAGVAKMVQTNGVFLTPQCRCCGEFSCPRAQR